MTIELQVEQAIQDYLVQNISDYEIEVFSTDIDTMLRKAKESSKGLIVVAHSAEPADYEQPTEHSALLRLNAKYVITILVNDRQDRTVLYELLDTLRTLLFSFDIDGFDITLTRHSISPQKFPDTLEGVYIGEIELRISTIIRR